MKKFKILLFILLICVFFSNCNDVNEDNVYIEEQSKKIIQCFDEKDAETLKSMFCSNTKAYYDLDTEIQNAFDKYEGKSTSYIVTEKSWAGGKDNGEFIDKHFIPQINSIITDEDMTYSIGYCTYTTYKNDQGKVGIGAISLKDSQGTEIAGIGGYDWN